MKLLFKIAGDEVAGVNYHNLGKLRIIDGEEYEDLISYRSRLNEIDQKETEIRSEMNEMSKDISTFISDVIEEKIKATQEVDRLIVGVTEREIRKQLKTELEDAKVISPLCTILTMILIFQQYYFGEQTGIQKGRSLDIFIRQILQRLSNPETT